jgi:hypothetical protein
MRYRRGVQLSITIVIVLLILTDVFSVSAWDISPKATELDKLIKGFRSINFWQFWGDEISDYLIQHYTIPVHEAITHRIYGCTYDFKVCSSPPKPYSFASDAFPFTYPRMPSVGRNYFTMPIKAPRKMRFMMGIPGMLCSTVFILEICSFSTRWPHVTGSQPVKPRQKLWPGRSLHIK